MPESEIINETWLNSEPVRVAYIVLSAIVAILTVFGIVAPEALLSIVAFIGGGEQVRSKVTPEVKVKKRLAAVRRANQLTRP